MIDLSFTFKLFMLYLKKTFMYFLKNDQFSSLSPEAEEVAEATSFTSLEVGADAGAGRGKPRRWRCGGCAKASISFFFFFLFFHVWMAYIPVAPDSFGATGCPPSRVLILIEINIKI